MQTFVHVKVYCLVCLVFIHTLAAVAQRPPTGGPNPPPPPSESCKGCPVLFTAVGVAVAGAAYYVVHRHFRTVPTQPRLEAQLVRRGILPNPDALNLMYTLNPRLKNQAKMRVSRKLVFPDFPPLAENQPAAPDEQTSRTVLNNLNGQRSRLQSNLSNFRGARIAAGKDNVNLERVQADLAGVEKIITAYQVKKEAGNAEQGQLLTDLLDALNQTLQRTLNTRQISGKDAQFIKTLSENVAELLLPLGDTKPGPDKRSGLYYRITPEYGQKLYASLAVPAVVPDLLAAPSEYRKRNPAGGTPAYAPPASKAGRNFAFAVYKIDSAGNAVVKGKEVEKKYYINYGAPALAGDPRYLHRITSLASFAYTSLYPSIYYLKVTDLNGKQMQLRDSLIDIRQEFRNPKPDTIHKMIIVPIYLTND